MSDYITDTARRILIALSERALDDGALHYDVRVLAQEWLAPSGAVEAPELTPAGLYRWTGPSGWHVQVNRFGDLYVSDSRVPAAERAGFAAIVRSAHALAAHLPDPNDEEVRA